MASPLQPLLPLPAPLRGSDIPSFAHTSIVRRLPEIAGRILRENELTPEAARALGALAAEIPSGKIRPLETPLATDAADWTQYLLPYLGSNWLEVPWFFAEHYFYRRVLEATGYYNPGPGRGMDPFDLQKAMGIQAARDSICALSALLNQVGGKGWPEASLQGLLSIDLGGNLIDLSRWPVNPGSQPLGGLSHPRQEQILVDDRQAVSRELFATRAPSGRVDFLLDNAGFELVCDLSLAWALLGSGRASQVQLHAKGAPVFVSDAMEKDVLQAVSFLEEDKDPNNRALGGHLRDAIERDQLVIREDAFWISPLPLWEMPAELAQDLGQSRFTISKGDANYRRLVGDRHWPATTPFNHVVRLGRPLLALRTLKSEVVLGLAPGRAEAAQAADPDWMSDGQWGLIQLSRQAWE